MRLRAVIFDDEPLMRQLLWSLLDRRGYEVFTFPDPVMFKTRLRTDSVGNAFLFVEQMKTTEFLRDDSS